MYRVPKCISASSPNPAASNKPVYSASVVSISESDINNDHEAYKLSSSSGCSSPELLLKYV